MRRSMIPFSCARFMMLSLNGVRQISGNNVRMSIFIRRRSNVQHSASSVQRSTSNTELQGVSMKRHQDWRLTQRPYSRAGLFDNFERGPLTMPRSRAGEQRANRANGLAVAANHAADVALSKLQFKDRRFAAGNFREHHLIGIFDQ